jgi:hypothetical protein
MVLQPCEGNIETQLRDVPCASADPEFLLRNILSGYAGPGINPAYRILHLHYGIHFHEAGFFAAFR